MLMRRWVTALTLVSLAFLAAGPARASDPDKYFPDGTDVVVQINLSQLMGAPLLHKSIPLVVKKYGEDALNMAANFVPDDNPAKKMMQDMAPQLKDKVTEATVTAGMMGARDKIQDFVIAVNTKEMEDNTPQLIMILRAPKIQAQMVAQMVPFAQASGQVKIKEDKVDGVTIYEFEPAQAPQAFFMAIPEEGVMLMSPFKKMVESVIKKKGQGKVDPKFKELLGQRKASYTVFAAGLAPKEKQDELKHFVATLTVDKDVNGQVIIECKDSESAEAQAKKLNDSLENALGGLKGIAGDRAELKPLGDALDKVKAEAKGSTVTAKLFLKGEDQLKALSK